MDDPKKQAKRDAESRRAARATAAARRLYGDLFTAEERDSLDDALLAGDLTQEIALLRVLVRRAFAAGEATDTISRAVGRLGQILRVQHVLSGDAARGLDEALAKVLEEIGNEIAK